MMSSMKQDMLNESAAVPVLEEQPVSQGEEYKEDEALLEENASVKLEQREKAVAEREAAVAELEKKLTAMQAEITQQKRLIDEEKKKISDQKEELECRETYLIKQDEKVDQRIQELHESEMKLKSQMRDFEVEANDARRTLEKELFDRKQDVASELEIQRKQYMEQLEQDMEKKRQASEKGIAEREAAARQAVDMLYSEAEEKRNALWAETDKTLKELRQNITEEYDRIRSEAEKEIAEQRTAFQREIQAQAAAIKEKEEELIKREEAAEKKREKADCEQLKNVRERKRQEAKAEELEELESDLEGELEKRTADTIQNYNVQLAKKDEALASLRKQLGEQTQALEELQTFKEIYGYSPETLQNMLRNLNAEKDDLEKRLAASPSKSVLEERDRYRDQCARVESDNENLKNQIAKLTDYQRGMEKLEAEKIQLEDNKQYLNDRIEQLQGYYETAQEEIKRLSSSSARLAEREERLKAIQSGGAKPLEGSPCSPNTAECDWLENIWNNCKDFGMIFPRRILYAFHTALKISDWSMITVLSGVSGTGKSELPKLYAAFGGMNFISVPVQPSWDSQESMLGFFNSIDNRFEPEPLLRFLYQCTENTEFSDYMSIVLLDEMNLAHVEHYFADFLSKLENRRSTYGNALPVVEVKLGAGVEPYALKLSRSILWTGTMNQDETTKSLSDKVLDRGLMIYFPRPTHLTDRKRMMSLEQAVQKSGRPLMKVNVWGKWITRDLDKIEDSVRQQINHYRELVEQINDRLEGTGRALGHRVWQAIEYYIVNYPTVRKAMEESGNELTPALREAMDIAFEDQLVQKVMPKLRGIETRGEEGKRLQNIKALLEDAGFDHLTDDFDLAMQLGYGQFIWSSAKYIQVEDDKNSNEEDSAREERNLAESDG